MGKTLGVINQKLVTTATVDQIRSAIESGELVPGQRVSEQDLTSQFQVSRTPVREAFRILEAEGYLVHSPRCGVVVKELNYQEIIDVFEVRSWLEQLMVRKITNEIDSAKMRALESLYVEMKSSIDDIEEQTFQNLDNKFHEILVSFCTNLKLVELIRSLKNSTKLVRKKAGFSKERAQESFNECMSIIEAIKLNNGDLCAERMREHFEKSLKFFVSRIDNLSSRR